MKLSEAILKGCEGTNKYYGDFFGPSISSCSTWGAAAIGAGFIGRENCKVVDFLDAKFGYIEWTLFQEVSERTRQESRESIAADLARRGM